MAKKTKIILSIVVFSITAIIIALAVLIKLYITPERVKAFLIPEAEKALNRKVGIGEINIGLFKGIEVKDFTIKEEDEETEFVRCKDFVLKYKLLPLLSKKVVISELKLISPEIRIERNLNGKFNYEGIIRRPEEIKEKEEAFRPKQRPVSLLIDQIVIKNASFSFLDLKKELPEAKGSLNINMSVKSTEGTDSKISGSPEKTAAFKIKGDAALQKISIAHRGMKVVLDGNLKFDEETLNIDLNGTVGKNTAHLKGHVKSYLKDPEINLNLYSKQISLDEIVPVETAKDKANPVQKDKTSPDKISGDAKPLNLKIAAEGEINIESARYKNLTMSNIYAKYRLRHNKLEIINMSANAGKGKFSLNSVVDLSKTGYAYNLSGNITSIHTDEVVNTFFPKARDTVFGILSFNLKLNGAGTSSESIKRNLIADGDFNIKDGRITNSKIPENLALFLGIDELRTINLRQANGTIKIKNGIARLDSIFSSDDISMDPSGNIGLDGTLDLAFDLKLSPRFTAKVSRSSNIASYIKDEKGWGSIPLRVSGTFTNPSYGVDVSKAGRRVIEKKGREFIKGFLEKDKDEQKGEEVKQKDKKPVEDLFKGLFK